LPLTWRSDALLFGLEEHRSLQLGADNTGVCSESVSQTGLQFDVRRSGQFAIAPTTRNIGFSKGLINDAHGELTASPYIELQSDLRFPSIAKVSES